MVDRDVLIFSNVIDHVHADVFPICVIVAMRHGLDEPILVAGDEAKRCRARAQWQGLHIFAHLLSKFRHCLFILRSVTVTLRLEKIKNPIHPAQLKSAVMAQTDASWIRSRVGGNHRLQTWRVRQSKCMLCSSGIRRAYGPNGTIGPGLGANPLGSVVAVVNIVAEKSPDTFRIEPAPHILEYDHVPLFDPVVGVIDIIVFTIWRALQDHRKLAFHNFPVLCWTIDIRCEAHIIAHGNHDVGESSDVIV